jgi:hypothetical protein
MTTLGGLMGVYGISQGIRKVREFEDTLGDLALQGKKSNTWLDVGRKKILEASSKWGIMKDEVLGFTNTLVGYTGNLDEAVQLMDKMGMVATATRAPMQNLAGTVYQLQKNLGLSAAQTPQAMALMRQMEMEGKFTFSHFAQHGGRAFGGLTMAGKQWQGMSGLRGAGALLEFATSKYSAGQEGTSAEAVGGFLRDLWLKRKKLKKKIGLQVEGRDLPSVLKDLAEKMQTQTMSDKALNVFGEQGKIIATGLKGGYGQWGQTYGKVFGMKADPSLLMKQAAQKMEQPAQKWKKTMADLDAAMHRHLLPVMKDIVKLMPSVAKGLKWAMDNFDLLFRAFIAFKASGAIMAIVRMFQQMQGGVGGGGVGGAVGNAALLAGGGRGAAAGQRVAGKMGKLKTAGLIGSAVMSKIAPHLLLSIYGPEVVEWLNRSTGGPKVSNIYSDFMGGKGASPHQASWWATGGVPLDKATEEAMKGERLKTENLQGQNVAGMLANLGIQPASKSMANIKKAQDMTDPSKIAARLKNLRTLSGRFKSLPEDKTTKEQKENYQKMVAEMAKLQKSLEKLAAKGVDINLPEGLGIVKNRSDLRSGRGAP